MEKRLEAVLFLRESEEDETLVDAATWAGAVVNSEAGGGKTMLKKVLVVDDSALIHQMYKMVLMRYRCEIVQALNGQEGLDKLEKNPDVSMMLVDINMPLMNGLEFIRAVRQLPLFKFVPILFLTTESQQSKRAEAKAAGASGWLFSWRGYSLWARARSRSARFRSKSARWRSDCAVGPGEAE